MENPANAVIELTMSYAVPRCLHVVAELGVADALDDTPRTPAELAMKAGADADALARALRLLSKGRQFKPSPEDQALALHVRNENRCRPCARGCDAGIASASRALLAREPESLHSYQGRV
jgi:hypothetical protein